MLIMLFKCVQKVRNSNFRRLDRRSVLKLTFKNPRWSKRSVPSLYRVSLPFSPFPLWNFASKIIWPLFAFAVDLCVVSGVTLRHTWRKKVSSVSPTQTFHFLRPYLEWKKGSHSDWNLCNTSVFHRFQQKKKKSLWDSPAHLWFINWWFTTQRHICNANISALVLLYPDVRHKGTAVQVLLGFVNAAVRSVNTELPVWFGPESVGLWAIWCTDGGWSFPGHKCKVWDFLWNRAMGHTSVCSDTLTGRGGIGGNTLCLWLHSSVHPTLAE